MLEGVIIRVESCKVDRKRSQISSFSKITFSPFAPMFHDAYPRWFFLITKGLLAMALSSEFRQNQGSFWQMYRYPRILSHSTLLFIRCFLAIDLLPIRIYNLICARFFFRTERFFLYEMDKFLIENFGLEAKKEWGLQYLKFWYLYSKDSQCNSWYLLTIKRSKSWKDFFLFLLVLETIQL